MREIPVAEPRAGMLEARADLVGAFESVLDGGSYILGNEVERFEREWATRCGTTHAVGVSSGTDALALALRAVGVGPGDEVLVPAMTAVATWMAVSQIGAVPVGVDIETARNGMDPGRARRSVTSRTRALVAVHLFGQVADVAGLGSVAEQAGIPLVEDAAQAHGASVAGSPAGSLGAAAAFSFYPTKNLGTPGDAGAVTSDDPQVADRVRMLREYGWRTRADAELTGINARLDELHASLLSVMLARLHDALARRRAIADAYLQGLAGIRGLDLPRPSAGEVHAWHLFVVRHPRRDALADALSASGIGTAVHYRSVPPFNSAFTRGGARVGSFPVAELHAAQALSLPLYPQLSAEEVERVVDRVSVACSRL